MNAPVSGCRSVPTMGCGRGRVTGDVTVIGGITSRTFLGWKTRAAGCIVLDIVLTSRPVGHRCTRANLAL